MTMVPRVVNLQGTATMSQKADLNGMLGPWSPSLEAYRATGGTVTVGRRLPRTHTVVLADAQPAIRDGVRAVLERSAGISVVGEAGTTAEVIAQTSRLRPGVLVIDPLIDESSDTRVITRVLRVAPDTAVLVFSSVDDDKAIISAIHAGARGYLVKSADSDQILRGIQAVAAGQAVIDKAIACRLAELIHPPAVHHAYPFPQLTNRERDVLERIAAGKSNMAIARELTLASKTISNRISAIFGKLGVADRSQAIVLAREAGLGRD